MSRASATGHGHAVLEGFLLRLRDIVGEGAAAAIIRYNAFEEGQAFSRRAREDLALALELTDEALGLRTVLVEDSDARVKVRVRADTFPNLREPPVETFVTGLLEGILVGARRRRVHASVTDRDAAAGTLLVTLDAGDVAEREVPLGVSES